VLQLWLAPHNESPLQNWCLCGVRPAENTSHGGSKLQAAA